MKNIALGQEEVYSCAFWLLTMISLRNPWAQEFQELMEHAEPAGGENGS